MPGLSTESGPDNQNNPGIGSEKMVKILKIPTALSAFAFGITSTLSWQDFVHVSAKKAEEKSAKLTMIERGHNHIIPQTRWFIIVIKGFKCLFQLSDFAPRLSFVILVKLVPVFKTQFIFAHTKETRNQSSHFYIPKSFKIIYYYYSYFLHIMGEGQVTLIRIHFCFTAFFILLLRFIDVIMVWYL